MRACSAGCHEEQFGCDEAITLGAASGSRIVGGYLMVSAAWGNWEDLRPLLYW